MSASQTVVVARFPDQPPDSKSPSRQHIALAGTGLSRSGKLRGSCPATCHMPGDSGRDAPYPVRKDDALIKAERPSPAATPGPSGSLLPHPRLAPPP